MAAHRTSMWQVGKLDAFMGSCSCGYQCGPDTAYAINGALVRHVERAS